MRDKTVKGHNIGLTISDLIWCCYLLHGDVATFIKSAFCASVISTWMLLKMQLVSMDVIGDHLIWYNSLIRVQDKPIFYQKAYEKGLIYVGQLFQGGQPISLAAAGELRFTLMQYNSIMAAIPQFWRRQSAEANDNMDNDYNAELRRKLREKSQFIATYIKNFK